MSDILNGKQFGDIYPTWIPVDESCPEFNSGTTCPMSIMKGKYDNCCDCKNNNKEVLNLC